MSEIDVLVVGGGPAGIAAACAMVESNRSVLLCDQSYALGGAVHRCRANGIKPIAPPKDLEKSWGILKNRLERCSKRMDIRLGTIFLGLDSTGLAVLKNHKTNKTCGIRPRMAIFATGAYEKVQPVPGWQLPGVMTAGGLQVSMKAAGVAPEGKVLLAGSGPLVLAVAAQLTKFGNAPVAVIEKSNPLKRPWRAVGAPAGYLLEAAAYVSILATHRIPWIRGAEIRGINRCNNRLEIVVEKRGKASTFLADIVGLHNGLQMNNIGLPAENLEDLNSVLIAHAGDCHELLGARAAPISGELAARKLIAAAESTKLTLAGLPSLLAEQRAQFIVSRVFHSETPTRLANLPDDTILCRCEQRTLGDLRSLLTTDGISAKEIKLLGRFGMGRCQGRFCSKWVQTLSSELGPVEHPVTESGRQRWPLRPASIGALANIVSKNSADDGVHRLEQFIEKR